MTTFSAFQNDIFSEIETGRGNLVIRARAGTGKSFTLVHSARRAKGVGLFLAFNKAIAVENERKLKGTEMESKTVHSCGLRALTKHVGGRVTIDSKGRKYRDMIDMWVEDVLAPTYKDMYADIWPTDTERDILDECGVSDDIVRLCDLARNAMWDPRKSADSTLSDIIAHYVGCKEYC